MKIQKLVLFSLLLGIALTSASTIRYEIYSVPDAEEVRYGLPFLWLNHQTSSIAGAVDLWSVQWLNLVINFFFWFIISAVIVFVLYRYKK